MKTIKTHEIPVLLRKRQGDRTQKELAEELGISPQHLGDLLMGNRMPGKALRRKIGIEKRITFVVKENPNGNS
jgi:transcriptional regulator with XRE-family HTH domain